MASGTDKLTGRVVPILFLAGVGLVLVGIGILDSGESSGQRVAAFLGGVALVGLSALGLPQFRRYHSD